MVLLLYGVHTEYLTLNFDFSMTFQLLKTKNGRISPDQQKVLNFLRKINREILIT